MFINIESDLKDEDRDLQWTTKVIGEDTRSEARFLWWTAQVNLAFISAFVAAYSSLEVAVERLVFLSVSRIGVIFTTEMIWDNMIRYIFKPYLSSKKLGLEVLRTVLSRYECNIVLQPGDGSWGIGIFSRTSCQLEKKNPKIDIILQNSGSSQKQLMHCPYF